MSGINKVILVGNLGQDPEVRYTPGGDPVTSISVVTSEAWKDKNTGGKKEKTEWHRVVFFGAIAAIAGEYLRKGSKVYLEGKLQTRKWQDKSGQDRYTTEVIVSGFGGIMQMLGGKSDNQHNYKYQPAQQNNNGGQSNIQQGQQYNQQNQGNSGQQNQPPQQQNANYNQAPQQQNNASQNQNNGQQNHPVEDDFDDGIPF